MSGHSKWSKVKHQKATTDVVKAAAFTRASRGITIALKEGGGITDPSQNFHLRLAIEKARSVNMPKENIERAIEKAKKGDGEVIHQIVYEAYGPFGVALYIEAATNNINRTVSYLKQVLEHAGGSMGTPGAVSYLFTRRGIILIPKTIAFDVLYADALEAGADDIVEKDDVFEVYTRPETLGTVRTTLEKKHIPIESFSIVMEAKAAVPLTEIQEEAIEALLDRMEESDDIQRVYATI